MLSKQQLGAIIKRFRLERNVTLKEIELKAGVSATHVSEIERGKTSPTVGALERIAKALGTEPSYFLDEDTSANVSVIRRGEHRVLKHDNWGATIRCLSNGSRRSEISMLDVDLDPGLSRDLKPLTHDGEELVHILRGVVEIHIGDGRHLMKEGDSLHFRSDEPHTIRNIGDANARVLWIATPPFRL